MEEPIAKSKWSNQLRGFILGFANSNFFFAYGVCYFYGSSLIRNSCPDELDIMEVFKVAIAVLQGTFFYHFFLGMYKEIKLLSVKEATFIQVVAFIVFAKCFRD